MTADARMISKIFFRLLPIQILLAVVGTVGGIVSSLFASKLVGLAAMSAIGLYGPVGMFLGSVSLMLIGGAQILCGKYMGRDQLEHTQQVFSLDLTVAFVFCAVSTALLLCLGLFDWTGLFAKDAETRACFNQYLLGQAIGIVPSYLAGHLAAFLALERQTKRSLIASIVCIIVNLLLNFLFVKELQMGAFGLGLAASLGQFAFFAIQAQYYFTKKAMLRFTLRGLHWGEVKEILRIGAPGAASNGYQTLRRFLVNGLIMTYVGSAGLSAFAASDALLGVVWCIPTGFLAVSRMLISICVGEEDRQSLCDVMRTVVYKAIPLMCAVCAVVILAAEPLTRLYYRDPGEPVYWMTVWAFRILPLCMPFSVFCMNFGCYGQSADKQVLVHVVAALDGVVCVAGFSALLVPRIGMNGVYVANVLNGLVCVAVFVLYAWAYQKHFPRNMDELMAIPKSFGAPPEDRIDLSLRSVEEVVRVAERVQAFCLAKGVDGRRATLAGLCMEEMAGNIVEHGFTRDKKKHTVDVRVVYKDGGLILRIKDDCVPFDPAERSAIVDPADPARNIGIRTVYAIATKISYQNILGLNVLTITV